MCQILTHNSDPPPSTRATYKHVNGFMTHAPSNSSDGRILNPSFHTATSPNAADPFPLPFCIHVKISLHLCWFNTAASLLVSQLLCLNSLYVLTVRIKFLKGTFDYVTIPLESLEWKDKSKLHTARDLGLP